MRLPRDAAGDACTHIDVRHTRPAVFRRSRIQKAVSTWTAGLDHGDGGHRRGGKKIRKRGQLAKEQSKRTNHTSSYGTAVWKYTSLSILTARVLPRLVTAWPGVVASAAMKAAMLSVVPATTEHVGGKLNLDAMLADTGPTTAPGIVT